MPRPVLPALLLAGALTFTGCGDDEPSGTTSPSPPVPSPTTTTPAADPTSTVPTMPAEAKQDSKAGAIAFVKYYVEVYNVAQATGDVAMLKTLASDGCRSCEQVVSAITNTWANGGRFAGGEWSVGGALADPSIGNTWLVTIAGQIAPSTVIPASGSPRQSAGGRASADFHIEFVAGSWYVNQWNRI